MLPCAIGTKTKSAKSQGPEVAPPPWLVSWSGVLSTTVTVASTPFLLKKPFPLALWKCVTGPVNRAVLPLTLTQSILTVNDPSPQLALVAGTLMLKVPPAPGCAVPTVTGVLLGTWALNEKFVIPQDVMYWPPPAAKSSGPLPLPLDEDVEASAVEENTR